MLVRLCHLPPDRGWILYAIKRWGVVPRNTTLYGTAARLKPLYIHSMIALLPVNLRAYILSVQLAARSGDEHYSLPGDGLPEKLQNGLNTRFLTQDGELLI